MACSNCSTNSSTVWRRSLEVGFTCCSYCSGVRRGKRTRGLTCAATLSIIVHYFDLQKYIFFPTWQEKSFVACRRHTKRRGQSSHSIPPVIYKDESNSVQLEARLENDMIWLTRQQLAVLFGRDYKTISKHINNALREELAGSMVVAKFANTTP